MKESKKKINKRTRKKLGGLFLAVLLALVALGFRITDINITQGERYSRLVLGQAQQRYENKTIPYRRGDILDRNGTILATSERVYNVILDCKVVNTEVEDSDGTRSKKYYEPTIKALVNVLSADETEVRNLLKSKKTENSSYYILIRGISKDEKEKWTDYTEPSDQEKKNLSQKELAERRNVRGVWFEDDYKRVYPLNSLACDAIGFSGSSDDTASYGIEGYYSSVLTGVNGRQYGYFNDDDDVEQRIIEPQDGKNVVSTLDVNIQQIIREAIEDFNTRMTAGTEEAEEADENTELKGAENVGVLVMNPNTGEILGMDSTDWYDLNNPRDLTPFYTDQEIRDMNDEDTLNALNGIWSNYTISSTYEPGSTFKPITVSAALDTGAIDKDDTFVCNGYEQFGDDTVIHCTAVHGTQTIAEALRNSCNDALMQIGAKLGKEQMLSYQKQFNFGQSTGVDLPNEKSGILFAEDAMGAVELASTSFGQGFTCTMIQEAAAFSTVINGGTYYKPHIASEITNSSGQVLSSMEPTVQKNLISRQTSDLVREALGKVMEDGSSASKAKVDGYSMGGKTGTAQKLTEGEGKYLVSFIGFAPVDDPQVVVYVVVDEPKAEAQDNNVYATEIAKQIFTNLLPYMNIFPEDQDSSSSVSGTESTEEGTHDTTIATPPEDPEENITQDNNMTTDGISNEEESLTNG